MRLNLARAALGQEFVDEAPVDIVICAIYERTTRGYGARGERYVHMEVGHAGQNIYLQATALGLATVAIGAFHDEAVREVLKLEKQYRPLYIMPVGRPA
jgi:SagB-type dehydrogenase family enzyme